MTTNKTAEREKREINNAIKLLLANASKKEICQKHAKPDIDPLKSLKEKSSH